MIKEREKMIKALITIILLIVIRSFAGGDAVYIIINKSVASQEVSVDQLRQLFLNQASLTVDGHSLEPLDAPESSNSRKAFYEKVIHQSAIQLKSYWARMIFTGKGFPPATTSTESEVETSIAHDQNKIGYLSYKPKNPDLKILKVVE